MKKCSRCHAENFEDQKFCNLCGRELSARIAYDLYAGNPPSTKPPEPEEKVTPETLAYQHFVRAKDEIAKRNLDGAVAEFKKALAACPGDPMIERLLKKTEEARERAIEGKPAGPRTLKTAPRPAQAPISVPLPDMSASEAVSGAEDLTALKRSPSARTAPPPPGPRPSDIKSAPARRAGPPPGHAPSASIAGPASIASAGAATFAGASPLPGKAPRGHAPAAVAPRGSRARAAEAEEKSQRVAPHTGRFLELYDRAPSLSPALALDGRSDEGIREVMVNLLILGGFLIFGFLLLL